jgi:trimeric autotransporter adhesin
MKSIAFLTLLVTLLSITLAVAQVPQSINYQAVIRTDSGLVVPNKSVNIRLSIQDGLTTPAIYSELHTITTNQFGLVTLSIGKGAATTGVFAQINWAIGEKFLKTEVDIARTNNYTLIGVQQFLSVPYALYAERAGNVSATSDGWKVVGNAGAAGQFLGTTNAQDLKIFTNNLQRAVFSTTGNTGIGLSLPTAVFHTLGTVRHEGLTTNNAANQIIVVDASGNLALRDVSTLPTGGGGASGWLLTGNTATAANFIGTNNLQDLRFYTEGSQKMVLKNSGNLGIGTTTPVYRTEVVTNSDVTGSGDRLQMQLRNLSNSNEALAGLSIVSGSNSTNTWLEHVGANYSVYSFAHPDFNDMSFLHSTGNNGIYLLSNSSGSNSKIRFGVGTSNNAPVTRMTLNQTGLGIGTETPKAKLEITNGDVYVNDSTKGIILKAPNGSCWRVTVDNTGNFVRTAITCPN